MVAGSRCWLASGLPLSARSRQHRLCRIKCRTRRDDGVPAPARFRLCRRRPRLRPCLIRPKLKPVSKSGASVIFEWQFVVISYGEVNLIYINQFGNTVNNKKNSHQNEIEMINYRLVSQSFSVQH